MGSNKGNEDEKPVHQITLSNFNIGKFEVSQKEWFQVTGCNPSKRKEYNLPVEFVSWYDAIEFCNKFSELAGFKFCYSIDKKSKDMKNQNADDFIKWVVTCDFKANGYRLPTEAEWEYAARGGLQSANYIYSGNDNLDDVAWYDYNSELLTHPGGEKKPNELGIYDMSGNVLEWCWDWCGNDYYSQSPRNDPSGPYIGVYRTNRGGSYQDIRRFIQGPDSFRSAEQIRSTNRNCYGPSGRSWEQGLRLCRTADY